MTREPLLITRKLTKHYVTRDDVVNAFENVSLTVGTGEFVSIIGPSGCGKSTLLHVIAGLEPKTSGEVQFVGAQDPPRPTDFGYMMQQDLLMPWLEIVPNVALGLEMQGVPRTKARARARGALEHYGLGEFADLYPTQLSGGMRQRAALIRTLLVERPVILLDEPFGALDAMTRAQMQEWLLTIWEEAGRTVIFVTHDVEESVFLSDRVLVMSPRPGRIAAELTVDLPRPRRRMDTTSDRFVDCKHQLLAHIYGDQAGNPSTFNTEAQPAFAQKGTTR